MVRRQLRPASSSGRRLSLLVSALLVGLVSVMGHSLAALIQEEPSFFGYAACSPDGVHHYPVTDEIHVCQQGDRIWAVLRGNTSSDYRLCLKFGSGPISCGAKRHLEAGTSSIAIVPSKGFVGLVTLTWRIGSKVVGRPWEIRFLKDPIVPAFGLNPLILSGTHQLFGLLIRHIAAGLRVRAWRQCDSSCPLDLHLVSSGGESRRYKITGPRSNAMFSLGDLLYVQVYAPRKRHRGAKLWGRLYVGKFVRDPRGGPGDTAIHRVALLCTPPGASFRRTTECRNVRG